MEVLVTHDDTITADELATSLGGTVSYVYNFPNLNMALLALPDDGSVTVADVEAQVGVTGVTECHNDDVTTSEVNTAVLSIDYQNSWGVTHIQAHRAHAHTKGEEIKVAVLDTGVADEHRDLVVAGGYNAVDLKTDPPTDRRGHGTHVCGIIAAKENQVGCVGVSPNVQLYAVKVLGDNGSGSWSNIMEGLEWSIANGMHITNHSYGGTRDPGGAVKAAYDDCAEAGIIQVAAAGNTGAGVDTIIWPAKFKSCMAVGAIKNDNTRASFSATGPNLDCVAPGYSVLSSYIPDTWARLSGTSMATPHVAGAIALALSYGFTKDEVLARIQTQSINLGTPGFDEQFGWGLVDCMKLLGLADYPKYGKKIHVDWSESTDDGEIVEKKMYWGDGRVSTVPPHSNGIIGGYEHGGIYTIKVEMTDDQGGVGSASETIEIEADPPPPPTNKPPNVVFVIKDAP